jgi:DNA-3-methyladenine glycosylase II
VSSRSRRVRHFDSISPWALRRRAHNAIDRWDGRTYSRALELNGTSAAIAVRQVSRPAAPRLTVTLAGPGIGQEAETLALAALTRLLGLTVDLSAFVALASQDPLLDELVRGLCGLKPPRFPSVFEAVVNAIACQQLSLEVGIHLLNLLTTSWGSPVGSHPDALRAFPTPQALASADPAELRRIGFSSVKARTIVDTARALADGSLDLDALAQLDDPAVVARLTGLSGIGRWSAEYVMLRGLGRMHVPGDDVGARNKLERLLGTRRRLDYEGVRDLLARWQPYAGVLYFCLLLDSLSEAGVITAELAT